MMNQISNNNFNNLSAEQKKDFVESFFSMLSALDLHVKSKTFGDGYFIFDMGENSVCHFTLKEMPNWKFGIWITNEYAVDKTSYSAEDGETAPDKIFIFCEHKKYIDKFKPSATIRILEQDIRNTSTQDLAQQLAEAAQTIKDMSCNKLKMMYNTYANDKHLHEYNWWRGIKFYFSEYLRDNIREWITENIKETFIPNIISKYIKLRAKILGVQIETDLARKYMYPRNTITVIYPKEYDTDDIDSEEFDKLFKAYSLLNKYDYTDYSLRIENVFMNDDGTYTRPFYFKPQDND